jgi:uncharacterized protein
MSRSKKSRKPGSAPSAKPKLSKKELESVEKRIRKSKGKKAGNRQQEAAPKIEQKQATLNKDPRLGSKKPIILLKETIKSPVKKVKKQSTPLAAVRTVEPAAEQATTVVEVLAQELERIEDDQALQAILAKQEQALELSAQEVDYFNEKMTRHQEICTALGYDDDEDDEALIDEQVSSEDDLWDKLDNNDLSKF